jgi:hypothetical protein
MQQRSTSNELAAPSNTAEFAGLAEVAADDRCSPAQQR